MAGLLPEFQEITLPVAGEKANGAANGATKRPPAQFWLNLGLIRRNSAGEEVFCAFAAGVPLDGVKPRPIPSSATKNQEFRNQRLAEAQLTELILKKAAALKPGETYYIMREAAGGAGWALQLRHVAEKEVVDEGAFEQNPLALGPDFKL